MIIDATNLILGRMASFAAKKVLLGEHIDIINCEKAIVSGNKKSIFQKYQARLERGSKSRGPFTYRRPDMFVKRVIRGMLPYRKEIGKKALKQIKCYIGVPEQLKDKSAEPMNKIKKMDVLELSVIKYTTVKDICRLLGWKL